LLSSYFLIFISIVRSDGIEHSVLECGDESWTYSNLDALSTGLALKLQKYGPKPVALSSAKITPTSWPPYSPLGNSVV